MSDYDDTNRGVLFKQEDKTNDKAPDYKGKFNYKGSEFKIAGWVKVGKTSGKPFLSISVDDFVPQEKAESAAILPADIPF
tara:strand:+ start:236 stop:475 length:240 start_codon:yes stop_codon:yes gene_type:complete